MLEKVRQYFNQEYNDLVRALEGRRNGTGYQWMTEQEFVNRTITDCLAVAQFSQTIGVKYEDVNKMYETLKKSCENLLTDQSRGGTIGL